MTESELLARFPGTKVKDFYNPYKREGVSQLHIQVVGANEENKGKYAFSELDKSKFPDFADVESLSIDLFNKRSYEISVIYDDSVTWENTDQFVSRVSEALNLPRVWRSDDDDLFHSKTLSCSGFRMTGWVVHKPRSAATLSLVDTLTEKTIQDRFENRHQTFKP